MIISLKGARNTAGFTQKEVAKRLNISTSTVKKLENNSSNISKQLLDKMTDLYNVDQDDIYLGKYIDYQKMYKK